MATTGYIDLPVTTGTMSGILTPVNGGTGTSIVFTQGSVIFAGPSGIYAQDNANFRYNSTSQSLALNGTITDASGNIGINMVTKQLWDYIASRASLDWVARDLFDDNGHMSLNWQSRRLQDVSGNDSVIWSNRLLLDSSSNNSVDYGNRVLLNAAGTNQLSYGSTGVGINTTTPNAAAILDVTSTTQGLLFPRMTTTQRNAIATPPEGLVVYDLTLHKLFLRTVSAWEQITSV